MNIIAVDDERRALHTLEQAIKTALPDAAITGFIKAQGALEYAKKNRVDIAFLDIQMSEMNGLLLAKHLKEIYSHTNIIFVTAYSRYTGDALTLRASGYVMKPINPDHVREEIANLRNPLKPPGNETVKGIRVQCFGNFEVYVDGKPLHFARSKTKDLFAYLVSKRGALCNNNETAAVIWEDEADSPSLQSNYRNLVADLSQTLSEAGIHDLLVKQRGFLGIAADKVSCDFFDFCVGINVNSYKGEFMNQYSWAEFTNAYLGNVK